MEQSGQDASLRVFFGCRPGVETRERLACLRRAFHRYGRPVPEDNIHLTLVFVGRVTSLDAERLAAMAESVQADSFTLTLDRYGYWPRPRVLWVGASTVPPALFDLQARLSETVRAAGFHTENRAYAPHVTLVRKARRSVARFASEAIPAVDWTIDRFALFQSEATETGVRYPILWEQRLR